MLETERLKLRAHTANDFEACVALWSDPAVTRYTIGEPATAQRTWLRILGYRGHWEIKGYGYWAIEHKASGKYIGEAGLADFKRDDQPLIEGVPEIGWVLTPSVHGQGFASEAAEAALMWADRHLAAPITACIVHRENFASLRIAAKLGYESVLQHASAEVPQTILARTAPPHT